MTRESFLPELIHHQDEPIADWVCVPLYFVSKLARDSGTIVVQVGEGADEIFHGYQKYVDHVRAHRRFWGPFDRVPRPLRMAAGRAAVSLSRRTNRGVIQRSSSPRPPPGGCRSGAVRSPGRATSRTSCSPTAACIPTPTMSWTGCGDEAEQDLPGADLLQKMTYLELRQRLAELLLMRVDKMTMATSVEARVPYLDHHLVEFALALPPG